MKKLYSAGWILLAAAALISIFTGVFNEFTLVAFSLAALALVYALALWSVIVNAGEIKTE